MATLAKNASAIAALLYITVVRQPRRSSTMYYKVCAVNSSLQTQIECRS